MGLPFRDFTNSEWVFEEYRAARPLDFEIAAAKEARVAIHHFEGIDQPVLYDREHARALPHYSANTDAALELFNELENAWICKPIPAHDNLWCVKFMYEGINESSEFGNTLPETICKAWLSWKKWVNQNRK